MSRNERSNAQQHTGRGAHPKRLLRKPDERTRRTRDRLGSAFVALIHEKPIEDVTVQNVLDLQLTGNVDSTLLHNFWILRRFRGLIVAIHPKDALDERNGLISSG